MALPVRVAICSYRLGGTDGVSIEAAKWANAIRELGIKVSTIAGSGTADVILPGLAADADTAPEQTELAEAFAGAQVVIVENLCSLPLNVEAGKAVASVLSGRPAVLHHHDLSSERAYLAHHGPPPTDPAWVHICVNRRAADELIAKGIDATVVYNRFTSDPPIGDREITRARFDIDRNERVVLQPTRAIERKAVPLGLRLAEQLGATYWLSGPAEDGYDDTLAQLLGSARTRVIHRPELASRAEIHHSYAACDLVVLPSTWEGFGNATIESATHRRPFAVGSYPVANEIRIHGFRWFDVSDSTAIEQFLVDPDPDLLRHNADIARRHFSLEALPRTLHNILEAAMSTQRATITRC